MLQTKETVNHPDHYQTRRGIEAIDVMEAFTENMSGDEAVLTATILKYMLRWKKKNGVEDLKKAQWYLDRLITKVEGRAMETMSHAMDAAADNANSSLRMTTTTAYNACE